MKKIIFLLLFVTSLSFSQLDSVKNFALGKLNTGISSSATTIILLSGQGSRFPLSTYNLTIWDLSLYGWNITNAYLNGYAEIVRVTARSGDTLTVIRAQEGTTARTFNTTTHSYYITLTINAKLINNISDTLLTYRAFIRSSTNQAELDSIFNHRTLLNTHTTTLKQHLDSIAALRNSIVSTSNYALSDSIRRHTDSLLSHNNRINTTIQRGLDSASVHRTILGQNTDTLRVHRSNILTGMDSVTAHRTALNTLTTNKATTFVTKYENASGATIYVMLGGITPSANNYQVQIPVSAGTWKNLRVWLVGNTAITGYGVTVQKNGVDQTLAVVASAGALGTLTTDLVHTFTTASNDLVNYKFTATASGFNPTFCYVTVEFQE